MLISVRKQCYELFVQNAHKKTRLLYFIVRARCHRKERHVRYLISWWVSCIVKRQSSSRYHVLVLFMTSAVTVG